MSAEGLYHRHRPKLWKHVVGQQKALLTLRTYTGPAATPHVVLFTGPSGTGKTTCARILAGKVGAGEANIKEHNCANERGIDMVRELWKFRYISGFGGHNRVVILDEAHQLTPDAQTALLKLLEDPPERLFFFICTTHPAKLLPTIKSRCTPIVLESLTANQLGILLTNVAKRENFKLHQEVGKQIIEVAEGSPRTALVMLEKVMGVKTRDEQLAVVRASDVGSHGHEIFRLLMRNRVSWGDVKKAIKNVVEDPEGVRRIILACATTALLNDQRPNPRSAEIIEEFRDDWFSCGRAGLVAACWALVTGGRR